MISYNELFPKLLNGHQGAVAFNLMLYGICETWDDLIDGDPVKPSEINGAFFAAFIDLPRMPFYQQNFSALNALLQSAIFDWFTANELEKRGDIESLRAAYILRTGLHRITAESARIIGGVGLANKVNLELHTIGEKFDEYLRGHGVKE